MLILSKEQQQALTRLGHTGQWRAVAEMDDELRDLLGEYYVAFHCTERPGIGFRAEWHYEGSTFSTLQATRIVAMATALRAASLFIKS